MIELIDSHDYRWDDYLNLFKPDQQDIYYTAQYCKLYETEDSKAKLFLIRQGSKVGIYPFLLKKIQGYHKDDLFDIETPYGYGGPIINNNDKAFERLFEEKFLEFCQEKNIVAEFIRFHPFMHNHNLFKENIEVVHNRKTIVVNVEKDIEKIWNEDISSKNRNLIRKAEKSGLIVEVDNDYETFIDMYNKTMTKVSAADYYFFDKEYYNHTQENKNNILMLVKMEGKAVAGGIFMGMGDYFHYHLSGSLKEFLKFSPNNLMLWEAIKYAHKKGFKKFHLGGGATKDEGDNLFKFKKNFSKEVFDFYIGKRVHKPEEYNYLITQWEKNTGKQADLLLSYR
jgi:lipid II:glycine glycyltransferase (peptidoglycan interpeptide bridge formation enzyme)